MVSISCCGMPLWLTSLFRLLKCYLQNAFQSVCICSCASFEYLIASIQS